MLSELHGCATRDVGKPIQPPLMPILIGGPFDRVGVDVLKLTKSSKGNQYAVEFSITSRRGQKYSLSRTKPPLPLPNY